MAQNEVVQLPVPEHLEQPQMARSLLIKVRDYFYPLWNADKAFRSLLASVGNKDAITGNRLFDRHRAVGMIKAAADEVNDSLTTNAKDGDIYKHIVHIMGKEGMGLKQRRLDYQRMHQSPAE